MARTTRTLNPLPFQDLEPKRFEDLVRQLLYDFRQWRVLEATGRGGSDDGFDARGYEKVGDRSNEAQDSEEDGSPLDEEDEVEPDRLWLIQCKREKSLTPAKMEKHLSDISAAEACTLYGVVFAVACGVSKATRDVFRAWCAKQGIQEAHIWAKSEIEDLIFQPKNDGILFAYFGISLQIRRRSIRTAIRARLATKKRCEKVLSPGMTVLLRDPEDDRYPHQDDDEPLDKRGWRVTEVVALVPKGVVLVSSRHFAYVADDGEGWDCLENFDESLKGPFEDPWAKQTNYEAREEARHSIWTFWATLPEQNKAWGTRGFLVTYDMILAIDETGDQLARYPHIYLEKGTVTKFDLVIENIASYSPVTCLASDSKRLQIFPTQLRTLPGSTSGRSHP